MTTYAPSSPNWSKKIVCSINPMKWPLRKLRFVARVLVLFALGTQLSLAVNAGFLFAPTQKNETSAQTNAAPSCHGTGNANADTSRRNCRLHCITDAQSVANGDIPQLPPSLEGLPALALQTMPLKIRIALGSWRDAFSTDPPIPIRFCSFLI